MVLRGAEFQRSGPAGCRFLTRRALSSYLAAFVQGRFAPACSKEARLRADVWCDSTVEISAGNLTKGSRRMAREGDLCPGHIGESSLGLQPW